MDQIEEIILKIRITELEALLVLCEFERGVLNRRIEDAETDEEDRCTATIRRDRTIIEWGGIMTELHELRERQAHEFTLTTRVSLN